MRIALTLMMTAGLLLMGLGTGPAIGQEAAPSANPAPAVDPRDRAISTFDTGRITVGDVQDAVASSSPLGRTRYKRAVELERLHEQLLRLELLAEEATKRGYDKHPEVRKVSMENAVQILIRERFSDQAGAQSVAAEDVKAAYQEQHAEFNRPELRRAAFILLDTKQAAQAVLTQAKNADLRAFRQLARERTIHEATKLRGGDLRYFDKDGAVEQEGDATVPAALAKAAFGLKHVGDVHAAAIELDGGFAVLKLTGKRDAVSRPLEQVESTLRTRLWRERRKAGIETLIAQLKERHKPEVHGELISLVKLPEAPAVPKGAGLPADFPQGKAPKAAPATPKQPPAK